MIITLLLSTLVMAVTPSPVPKAKGSTGYLDKANPPATIAAEVKKDCPVKPFGEPNHAEICIEGSKKYCPKGYVMKQRPHACPPGKMCVAVMTDYCEKSPEK